MKKLLFCLLILSASFSASAQSYYSSNSSQATGTIRAIPEVRYQQGYLKSDGSYVDGHYKTKPNSTNHDNFSTRQNTNPYTMQPGSQAQDRSPEAANYGRGSTLYTGPQGGQYYYNSNGNKTYVPKQPASRAVF